jgi:long-chain acyl-CoA synthetase
VAYGLVGNATERPEHPALVCGERRLGYGALDRLVNRTAHALAARGLANAGRVALMLPNDVEFFAVTQAAGKLGALAVPINYRWRRDELGYVLADSSPDVLVVDAAFLGEAEPALAVAGRPPRARVLVVGEAPGWPSFTAAIAEAPDTPPPGARTQSGYNIVIYTSGTTGRPKGVVHPHVDPALGFAAQRAIVEMWGFRPDDVHLMVGPAYHTMPSAYVAQHLFVGATSVLMKKFDAEECLQLIASERVTTSAMVPAHFIRLLELPDHVRARYDLSSVRKILHAAAPCPPHVKRRIMELFPPGTVWEFYGATEGPGTLIGPDEWLAKPGSVGRPWPGVTIKILDDDGRECAPGEVGTIYLSSRSGARFRYHNAEEKTAAAFRGDFFTVGDMGYLDADGYLFISDRKHDMVISGGVNVYPLEIEHVLVTHPGVVDAAVVGVPDARWGEALLAVVERRPGATLTADVLREWCRTRMADYKVPRHVEFVDELPRDPNGKVAKRFLRERYGSSLTSGAQPSITMPPSTTRT